jgi:DNA-binding NarL/FixJ family response regulator
MLSPKSDVPLTKSILLVDDKPFLRGILKQYLEQHSNYKICGEAEDGLDAIVKAQQLRPDLIVLDLQMPKMNGLDAAKRLKSLLPETTIVMLTAFDSLEIEREAMAVGINAVQSKSDSTGLVQCIRSFDGVHHRA